MTSGDRKAGPEAEAPFWKRKSLTEMTRPEWESLCDGCGRCCLLKLEDADTGEIAYTDIACSLLDQDKCRCTDYPNRQKRVPDCVVLTAANVGSLGWMPSTCAYRLLWQGKPLYDWHPLISGDPDSVHRAGISVQNKTVSEFDTPFEEWEDHIIEEPT